MTELIIDRLELTLSLAFFTLIFAMATAIPSACLPPIGMAAGSIGSSLGLLRARLLCLAGLLPAMC